MQRTLVFRTYELQRKFMKLNILDHFGFAKHVR